MKGRKIAALLCVTMISGMLAGCDSNVPASTAENGTEVKFESITDYEGDMAIRMQTEEYGDVLSVPEYLGTVDLPVYFEPLGTPEELSEKYEEKYLYKKYFNG